MEWKVTRLKEAQMMHTAIGEAELVSEGTRVLLMRDGAGVYCVAWNELSVDEVEDEFDNNECFEWRDTVTTVKGNTVKIYWDYETAELFFCVFSRK